MRATLPARARTPAPFTPRAVATPDRRPRGMATPRAAPATAPPPTTAGVPRPDAAGRYGRFGGKFVPETLIAALTELESEYRQLQADPAFQVQGGWRGGVAWGLWCCVRSARGEMAAARAVGAAAAAHGGAVAADPARVALAAPRPHLLLPIVRPNLSPS